MTTARGFQKLGEVCVNIEETMVGPNGLELEAFSGRLSPLPKSRAKPRDLKNYGRPEWTRTIDLFRVKEAL